MQNIIIYFSILVLYEIFWCIILDRENIIAECWNHKELLHHGVHVTNRAKIL